MKPRLDQAGHCIGAVERVQVVAALGARAPDHDGIVAVHHLLDQHRNGLTGGANPSVAFAVNIERTHNGERDTGVLREQRHLLFEEALGPAVTGIGDLGFAGEHRQFRQRRRCIVRVNAGRRRDQQMRHRTLHQFVHEIVGDLLVVLEDRQVIVGRIADAIGATREMEYNIGSGERPLHGLGALKIPFADFDAVVHGGEIVPPAFGKIVGNRHSRAGSDQPFHQERADQSGAAGDEDAFVGEMHCLFCTRPVTNHFCRPAPKSIPPRQGPRPYRSTRDFRARPVLLRADP